MATRREIKAKEIISDIISGITDNELMSKYKLTFRGLQSVFRQLVDLKLADSAVLKERILPRLKTETTVVTRMPRKEVFVPLPVQDADNPDVRGIIINITERGMGVKGLGADIDEARNLVIRPEKFFQLRPFILRAKCRWVEPSDDPKETLAGFEIISITPEELQKLKDLIGTLEYIYR
jgi:hypothetical protein